MADYNVSLFKDVLKYSTDYYKKNRSGVANYSYLDYCQKNGGLKNAFQEFENLLEGNGLQGDGTEGNLLSVDRFYSSYNDIFFETPNGDVIYFDAENIDSENGVLTGDAAKKKLLEVNAKVTGNPIDESSFDNIDFNFNGAQFSNLTFKGLADGVAASSKNGNHVYQELDLNDALKNKSNAIYDYFNEMVRDHGTDFSLSSLFGAEETKYYLPNGKVTGSITKYLDDGSMMVYQDVKTTQVDENNNPIIVGKVFHLTNENGKLVIEEVSSKEEILKLFGVNVDTQYMKWEIKKSDDVNKADEIVPVSVLKEEYSTRSQLVSSTKTQTIPEATINALSTEEKNLVANINLSECYPDGRPKYVIVNNHVYQLDSTAGSYNGKSLVSLNGGHIEGADALVDKGAATANSTGLVANMNFNTANVSDNFKTKKLVNPATGEIVQTFAEEKVNSTTNNAASAISRAFEVKPATTQQVSYQTVTSTTTKQVIDPNILAQIPDFEKNLASSKGLDLTACFANGNPKYVITKGGNDGIYHIYEMNAGGSSGTSLVRKYVSGGGYGTGVGQIKSGSGYLYPSGNASPSATGNNIYSVNVQTVTEDKKYKVTKTIDSVTGQVISEEKVLDTDNSSNSNKNIRKTYSTGSPLVFDLDNDGVVEATQGIGVDVDGNGTADGAASEGDGMLSMGDLNNDGQITGAEVFGNETVSPFTGKKLNAKNGFEALKMIAQEAEQISGEKIYDNGYVDIQKLNEIMKKQGFKGLDMISGANNTSMGGLGQIQKVKVDGYQEQQEDGLVQHNQLSSYISNDGKEHKVDDVWFALNSDKTEAEEKEEEKNKYLA